VGYPTQKPEALVERIILACSREGDTVLDAYCGSGTTLVAAERNGRRWIGIDISRAAVELARRRIEAVAGRKHEIGA
jgi:site-specific DNA-methyltransferase (adenine-specific)